MPQRTSVGCKSYFGVAKQALAFSPTEWVWKDLKMAHFVLNIPLLKRKHQRKCKNIPYFSINHTVVSALACSSANWEYWVFTQSRAFHQAIDWSIYTFKLLEFHIYLLQRSIKWAFISNDPLRKGFLCLFVLLSSKEVLWVLFVESNVSPLSFFLWMYHFFSGILAVHCLHWRRYDFLQ